MKPIKNQNKIIQIYVAFAIFSVNGNIKSLINRLRVIENEIKSNKKENVDKSLSFIFSNTDESLSSISFIAENDIFTINDLETLYNKVCESKESSIYKTKEDVLESISFAVFENSINCFL